MQIERSRRHLSRQSQQIALPSLKSLHLIPAMIQIKKITGSIQALEVP